LEEQMLKHARDLEFEEAAACRDQVQQLQSQLDRL
jgi:excinuclease ABC subunit B